MNTCVLANAETGPAQRRRLRDPRRLEAAHGVVQRRRPPPRVRREGPVPAPTPRPPPPRLGRCGRPPEGGGGGSEGLGTPPGPALGAEAWSVTVVLDSSFLADLRRGD